MRVELSPLFGQVPPVAEDLEIIGVYERRFEERNWATVWPKSGVVRWADGTIEMETLWYERNLKNCGDYQSKWSWFPRFRRGRFFNLSMFWSFYYYHWTCDVLARLHTLLPRLTPDVRVILPPETKPWQIRALELIGLPRNQWLSFAGKRPWIVQHLLYASPVAMTGDHEEKSLHWVRDTIWRNCLGGPPAGPGWRKLYLTRKNTWSRNLVNEEELIPVLLARGFELVDCATLSFDQQVRLFSAASFVVGPHGASFTNVLWSHPGTTVFEIFDDWALRRYYWSLCKTLGHSHHCGVAESVPNPPREPNILVNRREFETALDRLLAAEMAVAPAN